MDNLKHITVTCTLKIEGETKREKTETFLQKEMNAPAISLRSLAGILFIFERMFGGGTSCAQEVLDEYAGKLPAENGETPDSLFAEYILSDQQSRKEAAFIAGKNMDYSDFMKTPEGKELLFDLYELCSSFERAPQPIKEGFLYWLLKYHYNGNTGVLLSECKNPDTRIEIIVLKYLMDTEND